MKLKEIAAGIQSYLEKFEADKGEGGVNWWHDGRVNRTRPYFLARAYASGSRVFVTYVSYQGFASLKKDEALAYLRWLELGNVGTHYKLRHLGLNK